MHDNFAKQQVNANRWIKTLTQKCIRKSIVTATLLAKHIGHIGHSLDLELISDWPHSYLCPAKHPGLPINNKFIRLKPLHFQQLAGILSFTTVFIDCGTKQYHQCICNYYFLSSCVVAATWPPPFPSNVRIVLLQHHRKTVKQCVMSLQLRRVSYFSTYFNIALQRRIKIGSGIWKPKFGVDLITFTHSTGWQSQKQR